MKKFISGFKERLRDTLNSDAEEMSEGEEEYVELDTDSSGEQIKRSKILVRSFVMEDFSDVKSIIDTLRDGYTICLVNIKPMKGKDVVELKRAINKLKKTCDALSGDLAGFGEDWVVVTPGFAEVYRSSKSAPKKEDKTEMVEDSQDKKNKTVLEQYDTDDIF